MLSFILTAASRRRVEAATLVDCRGVVGVVACEIRIIEMGLRFVVRANRNGDHHVLARLSGTARGQLRPTT